MRQAALSGRAREALFNRTDDAGRPVADHEQRIAEPSGAQVLKNARTVSTSSLEPAINPSSDLRPSSPIPQAASTASRR
jgi:hypothetical protein